MKIIKSIYRSPDSSSGDVSFEVSVDIENKSEHIVEFSKSSVVIIDDKENIFDKRHPGITTKITEDEKTVDGYCQTENGKLTKPKNTLIQSIQKAVAARESFRDGTSTVNRTVAWTLLATKYRMLDSTTRIFGFGSWRFQWFRL